MRARFTLLLINSLVALAGLGIVYALIHVAMIEAPTDAHREATWRTRPLETGSIDRMAFMHPRALPKSEPPARDPEPARPDLRPSLGPDAVPPPGPPPAEVVATWSTETVRDQPEASTASRFALLPSQRLWQERLPWLDKRPGARRTYTLKARLAEIAPAASFRLAAKFEAAKAHWPPAEIALIAVKDEKVLELHARPAGGAWKLVHRYRVLAASGGAGPKLRQGDRQVPEGFYGIELLNPNSAYHVSLRVNYPNAFDRQMAAKEGRKDLGGDIMIHGKNLSAGCLAMGDEAVEELFVLAAQTGISKVRIIIAPTDLREKGLPEAVPGQPEWLPKLYADIATAMADYKQPKKPAGGGLLSFFSQ